MRHGIAALAFPYPLNYGEGPLLDQAVRLQELENIYPSDLSRPPYLISNYPPLFVLLQAPLVWAFGPAFLYGRAISLLCAVAVAGLIAVTINTLTRDRTSAVAGGLTFLDGPLCAPRSYSFSPCRWSSWFRLPSSPTRGPRQA